MLQIANPKIIVGLTIWLAIAAAAVAAAWNIGPEKSSATNQLRSYLFHSRQTHKLHLDHRRVLAIGDPVFLQNATSVAPAGRITRLGNHGIVDGKVAHDIAWVDDAEVTLFGSAPAIHPDASFELHTTPLSSEWVLKTMLPPEKREQIAALIVAAWQNHTGEIVDAFRPLVRPSLREAATVIREDLKQAFIDRDETVQALGKRFQSELVERELVPLLQDEIWPILKERSSPLASEIGTEIWQEMSVWRLGWRYLYDRSPLPDRQLAQKEFQRFVENSAVPILKSHIGDFLELQKTLVEDFSANEQIRSTVRKSIRTVIDDEEVQTLLADVFQEVFVDNPRLEATLEKYWRSDQARSALDLANARLDPTIREIGVALFGNPKTKITPEFARVLRNMVMHKDERWLVLHPGSGEVMSVDELPESFPVVFKGAGEQIPYAPARNRD